MNRFLQSRPRWAAALAGLATSAAATAQMLYGGLHPQTVPRFPTAPGAAPLQPAEQRALGLVTLSSATGQCSGTLLNQHWVLTAHHCVAQVSPTGQTLVPTVAPASITVRASWTAQTARPTRVVHFSNAQRIADFRHSGGQDLALLYLGQGDLGPVERDWYLHLWDGRWGQRIPGSQNVEVFGRGIFAWARRDPGGQPVQASFDGQYRASRGLTASGPSESYFWTSAVIAGGDSGGPSLVQVDTTQGTRTYLAGVHSFCSINEPLVTPLPTGWSVWDNTRYALCGDQAILPVVEQIRDIIRESPTGTTSYPPFGNVDAWRQPFTLYFVTRPTGGGGSPVQAEAQLQQQTYSWEGWNGPSSYPLGLPRTGLRPLATGWGGVRDVAAVGGGRFVSRSDLGELSWQHLRGFDGDGQPQWQGPRAVGRGFVGFRRLFGAGEGLAYGVAADGALYWYRDAAFRTGDGGQACPGLAWRACGHWLPTQPPQWVRPASSWQGPRQIRAGFGGLRHLFSAGEGVMYAVNANGELLWYRHQGVTDGAARWSAPEGRVVGVGWQGLRQVVSIGAGQIVALREDGTLLWFRHKAWNAELPAERRWSDWEGPVKLQDGLQNVRLMFADMPEVVPVGPN